MKIALRYGIAVTAVIMAWVALKHGVLHLEPARSALFDLVIFNLAAFVGLVFGIRAKRKLNGGGLSFGNGLTAGMSIVVTYTVLTCLYFVLELIVFGALFIQQEPGASTRSISMVVVRAFGGLFGFFLLLGLIYSSVISAVLRTRART